MFSMAMISEKIDELSNEVYGLIPNLKEKVEALSEEVSSFLATVEKSQKYEEDGWLLDSCVWDLEELELELDEIQRVLENNF